MFWLITGILVLIVATTLRLKNVFRTSARAVFFVLLILYLFCFLGILGLGLAGSITQTPIINWSALSDSAWWGGQVGSFIGQFLALFLATELVVFIFRRFRRRSIS